MSAFTSVDFPTPDAPTTATVRWPLVYVCNSCSPAPVWELTACTGTPRATARTDSTAASTSSVMSSLVRITTGSAPLS